MTPSLLQRVRFRAALERAIRSYFDQRAFVEVFAPTLVPSPGLEPTLEALRVSARQAHEVDGHYLHTSPEFAIKTVLGELDADVYCLARTYRDEPPSPLHSPEFTMLEWYRRADDYTPLMRDCEQLLTHVIAQLCPGHPLRIPLAGADARTVLDLTAPFHRLRYRDAFLDLAGVDPLEPDTAAWEDALDRHGVSFERGWDRDTLESLVWCEVVEPSLPLDRGVLLTEFPRRHAALARALPADPRFAERFELYLPGLLPGRDQRHGTGHQPENGAAPGGAQQLAGGASGRGAWRGIELANAFAELTDADEQRRRFEADNRRRVDSGVSAYPLPEAMLEALSAMGPTAGIALGVDRLATVLARLLHGWSVAPGDFLIAPSWTRSGPDREAGP